MLDFPLYNTSKLINHFTTLKGKEALKIYLQHYITNSCKTYKDIHNILNLSLVCKEFYNISIKYAKYTTPITKIPSVIYLYPKKYVYSNITECYAYLGDKEMYDPFLGSKLSMTYNSPAHYINRWKFWVKVLVDWWDVSEEQIPLPYPNIPQKVKCQLIYNKKTTPSEIFNRQMAEFNETIKTCHAQRERGAVYAIPPFDYNTIDN